MLDILSDPFTPTTRPVSGTGRKRRSENVVAAIEGNQVTDDYYTREASQGFDDLQQQKFEKYSVPAVIVESAPNEAEQGEVDDGEEFDEEYGPIPLEDDIQQDAKQFKLDDVNLKQPNNLATSRFTLYQGLEQLVSRCDTFRTHVSIFRF